MRSWGCCLIASACSGSLLAQPAQPASDPATAIASQFIETVTKAWESRDGRAWLGGRDPMLPRRFR